MKESGFAGSIIQAFLKLWHRLVKPSKELNEEDRPLSRVLNGVLLILVVVGGITDIEYIIRRNQINISDWIVITALILFVIAYSLNRHGYLMTALTLVLSAFIVGTFAVLVLQPEITPSAPLLFYLIIPILMGELFLSLRGYVVIAGLILAGILGLVFTGLNVIDLFSFFLIFSTLIGLASYHRRRIQKQRQASLHENEQRYRSVISAMAEGIIVQTSDGTIQTFNASAERILGLTSDQFQGRSLLDPRWRAIHEDGSDFPGEDYPTVVTLRTGQSQKNVIMGVYKPDGSLTWISSNTQPVFQTNELLPSIVVTTFTDITRERNLLADEKRHTRQTKLLNEIINASLETSDFQQMLQTFADRLGDLLEADGAYITIWDDANRRIISAALYGNLLDMQPTPHLEPGEMTLTESVLQAGHTLGIEDIFNTPHLSPRLATLLPARSVLALPLVIGNEKLGAALITFNHQHTFSPEEISICEQAARQVALAVSKAQVFEAERRRASQLALLEEASRRIEGALEQEAICQRTVEILVKRFGYAEAAIMISIDNDELKLVAINGTETLRLKPGFIQKKDEGIIGHVATVREVYIAQDLAYDPYYFHPTSPRSGSAISLPMLHDDQLLGVLYAESKVTNHFDADDIQTLQTLMAHVITGIQRARLYEAEQRRASQLTLLEEASRQIAGLLDVHEICQHVVQTVVRSFGYAEASILLTVENEELELIAIDGTEDMGFNPGVRVKMGRGIVGHVALNREVYITGDISRDPYYATPPKGSRTGSAMSLPMLNESELVGLLYIESVILNDFDMETAHTFQTLVSHIVTAIQRARLFAVARDRLRAIMAVQSVSQTIASSLELEQIFQTVVDMLKNTFGYHFVSIYLLDGEVLHLGAEIGYPPELVYTEIPLTSGIAGHAARSGQVQFIPEVKREPGFLRGSHEVESEICVPLLKEEKVLGVLNVESRPGNPLTQTDVDLLASLAAPIAIAVDNARLHSNVKSLALTDALTTLANRRAFDYALESEVARVMRYGPPLSLIILDIDSFKIYNDSWGHPAGDGRLRAVADLLRANMRHPDIAARYGGEEFALLLPFTDKAGAMLLAERLRAAAQANAPHESQNGEAIPGYTLSIGVSSFPEDGTTPEELLLAADNAELAAKRLGKNRVYAANSSQKLPNP